jgi:hypothetical protein
MGHPNHATASRRHGGPLAHPRRAQSPLPPRATVATVLSVVAASRLLSLTASATSCSKPSSDRAVSAGGCDRPLWGSPEGPLSPVSPGGHNRAFPWACSALFHEEEEEEEA